MALACCVPTAPTAMGWRLASREAVAELEDGKACADMHAFCIAFTVRWLTCAFVVGPTIVDQLGMAASALKS
eukprot:2054969-Alexandrium_andersonii.AAC.1